MLGDVIWNSGRIKGEKFPAKKALFWHFSLSLAVTKLRRGTDTFVQFTKGNLSLSPRGGGGILKFSSTTCNNGM